MQANGQGLPVWIRLPENGKREHYTGLSRSALNSLILGCDPPVRSTNFSERPGGRGVRLIHLESLLDYLAAQEVRQRQADRADAPPHPSRNDSKAEPPAKGTRQSRIVSMGTETRTRYRFTRRARAAVRPKRSAAA